jgi:hypothetical protein
MMLAAYGMGANGAIAWGRGGLRVMAAGDAANLSQRGIEGITSLDIHSDGADIVLIPSDGFGFDVRTYSGEPEWSAEGGKLTIHERAGSGWLINVDFPLLKENYGAAYIKVYYPEGDALSGLTELAAESASGSIAVPALGVRLRKAALATMSGSIYADSLEAGELALETVSGNINVSGVSPHGGASRMAAQAARIPARIARNSAQAARISARTWPKERSPPRAGTSAPTPLKRASLRSKPCPAASMCAAWPRRAHGSKPRRATPRSHGFQAS